METSVAKPKLPYLLFHPKFIVKHSGNWWESVMFEGVYALGWFREPCFAIDSECRRFPLLDVVSHGKKWTVWNLFPGTGGHGRFLKVSYVFGMPVQLSFDKARKTYVEFVCEHHWWSASHETEKQFRERNAKYTNIQDLMEQTSLNGRWPVAKRPKPKNRRQA